MAVSESKNHDLRNAVCIGALSLGVAFISASFVIRVVHVFFTSAGWEDSLDANDPIASLLVMIGISSVVYNLLTRIKDRHGLIASFEGACWLIGLVPVLFWMIHTGRGLPDISDYRYLGLILVIAAICSRIIRALLPKSATVSPGVLPQADYDSEVAGDNDNRSSPHQSASDARKGNTAVRKWMLITAAGAAIAVSAFIPRTFPLLDTESTADTEDNCRVWYNNKVVSLYKGRIELWAEWSNALNAFVKESGRDEQIISEIDAGKAPAQLTDRPEMLDKWLAAQDDVSIEVDIALLDDHWDDDEMRKIVRVRLIEMQLLMDALALDFLLADTAGFYPFPGFQDLESDLQTAMLGLEKACDLESN